MHQQKAGLQELDTDDYFDNDGQYIIQNNKKNILQPINLNATSKRENTQFTQSTALSHHLMQGCGVGTKFQTPQSISNQSIPNNYIDNSIQSKNLKDDQSETLYLTTQQSPKSTKNYSSSDQQQFSSMSQFQYICQKFQLKMEDIMQIMKGFQDKESKQLQESCQGRDIHQNLTQKENSMQEGLSKNKIHTQLFDQLPVPQQNQMNLRFQSEVSQAQSLNENGEQEEQQFSEQAPSYQINLNVNSNEGVNSNYHDSKQSSQDMPLQYNPYILKTKNVNDVKQSIQQSQRDNQAQIYKQELQKSQQFANNSQNTDTSSIISRQNSYQLQNQLNQINSSYKPKVDSQSNTQQISLKNEVKQQQQLSQQSNTYSSFNNKNTSFSSQLNVNNQKSDQYYETSLENQSEQQLQQQYENQDNYKQSVYSEQSGENDSYLEVRFSNSESQNPPAIPLNMRLLENDAEDFSCPMQFIKDGFIVYSINNGIKNFKVEEDNNNKQKDQFIATEINLFTSQSEQLNCNQDFDHAQNQQKQINQGRQGNDFNNDQIEFENENKNQKNSVQSNNLASEYLNQSDQKIDTQRSNQLNMQTEEISFTNQTFENRISRRFSEKNYLSNEYIQNNNKNSFSSSIQPQYTQERSDEEEQDYQQQIEDNDYAELERLRQLANGNSQIRIFTNRQSQYQKQNSQQESKTQEATSNNSSQQQNGMSIKEMKMSKQYQDPIHQIGQNNYPSFNNSNQIFGYQTEEKSDLPIQQQQVEHFLEEYQSEQNYFNQNQLSQQQQNQIIFQDNQQQNSNNFCNNSGQQINNNSIQPSIKSHKNSQQQFGLESFGEISYPPIAQQDKTNQCGLPNFQKDDSFNDQFSQTFSQQNPSQNFDSLSLNGVYQNQEIGNAIDSHYKQDGQLHNYYQNSTSIDQSQLGNAQNCHYYNQSNNSYQNYVAQMIDRYEEEIKRLQEQNQKQNLEIGELNGKIHGIQETKKDFELVLQSLKQNLECVTDLLKKKEEDYNKLFEKYNTLVEQMQKSESKNKYKREISPNKEYSVQDSLDRHTIRQYDLRSSSSKENRNSQEKINRCSESPNNILSQRDANCMMPLIEKQTSRKNLNYENTQFSQFKPPMIKNPKKIINYDENNRKTLKREFSESQLGQRSFQQMQVVQKIVQNSLQNELKYDKENIQKFSKKKSLSPNQQESRNNNTNRSKSPSYGLNSARISDENQRYQEPQKISTKRENLSGTRIQDAFLSSAKIASNCQNRYSDQFKKQKSNSYLQTNNFVQQDKQVLDELRNYCFRKKQ